MQQKHHTRALLVLMTRVPKAGCAKTRLIPELGEQGAADVQRELAAHVSEMMRHAAVLCQQKGYDENAPLHLELEARVVDGTLEEAATWLKMECVEQGGGDLGERMSRAMTQGFARGFDVVAVLGGDCPELDGARIREALLSAMQVGAALIPARDGGYCLFALCKDAVKNTEALFADMIWSTSEVCQHQVDRLCEQGVEPSILGPCTDIDEPKDLPKWYEAKRQWQGEIQSVSVVIPTYNEAQSLPQCLEAARAYFATRSPHILVEYIVVDGDSDDETREIARRLGCRVFKSPRGRARQMNAGAFASKSDALLFLHADTRLYAHKANKHIPAIDEALENRSCALGAFTFGFDTKGCSLREKIACNIFERNTRKRVERHFDPYGDQALFCRRATFASLGGWGTPPIMEDVLFGMRARAVGSVLVLFDVALTSPRRYQSNGFIKTMVANRRAISAYLRGRSLSEIAEAYQAHFRKSDS